jgi:hypothetical protein
MPIYDRRLLSLQARSLPLILVGPILRRSEQKQVCIWLACSRPVTVKSNIYRARDLKALDSKSRENTLPKPIGSATTKSLRLGQYLYIALVIVHPNETNAINAMDTSEPSDNIGTFPTGELLAYDLEIIDNDIDERKGKTLRDLGLLDGKNSIVYPQSGVKLPTFFLNDGDTPMNILHGSCRKLHGKGGDCLVAADELIFSTFADLKKRPSAIFLTGDQIYADDVADPLIGELTLLGKHILGTEEEIRGIRKRLSEIPIGARQSLVQKYAGFTSPNASNHLLSLGEFTAMYLMAWNLENWPERFADAKTIADNLQKRYCTQLKQLDKARQDLPAVRRVLANIPTYMIFDDHEITDDWNITNEWYENVRASKCGKQVVANGLAAYWAFQGWGNDPALYDQDFIDKMVEYFGKNDQGDGDSKSALEDYLWDFHGWMYCPPADLHTIVTDCRTQRQYDSKDGPPQLLSGEGLLSILRAAQGANFKKGDPVIIVSPTPVFGFLLIEALQKAASKITGVYKVDLETWYANESGFVKFLSFISQMLEPSHCIFLSGDVHYGFTINAVFALLRQDGKTDKHLCMNITQLNSSALKTTSLVKIAVVSEILGRIQQLLPLKQTVRVGWIDDGGGTSRLLSKSMKVKGRPTLHLQIQPRKGDYGSLVQRPPNWIEARSIVSTSGPGIPPLIISDNNVGLINIDRELNRITHELLVRKGGRGKIKVYTAMVRMNRGEDRLEGLIKARLSQIYTAEG